MVTGHVWDAGYCTAAAGTPVAATTSANCEYVPTGNTWDNTDYCATAAGAVVAGVTQPAACTSPNSWQTGARCLSSTGQQLFGYADAADCEDVASGNSWTDPGCYSGTDYTPTPASGNCKASGILTPSGCFNGTLLAPTGGLYSSSAGSCLTAPST